MESAVEPIAIHPDNDVTQAQRTPEWMALERMLNDAGFQLVVLSKEIVEQVERSINEYPEMNGKTKDEKVACALDGFKVITTEWNRAIQERISLVKPG